MLRLGFRQRFQNIGSTWPLRRINVDELFEKTNVALRQVSPTVRCRQAVEAAEREPVNDVRLHAKAGICPPLIRSDLCSQRVDIAGLLIR